MPGVVQLLKVLTLAGVHVGAFMGAVTLLRVAACLLIAQLFVISFRARRIGVAPY